MHPGSLLVALLLMFTSVSFGQKPPPVQPEPKPKGSPLAAQPTTASKEVQILGVFEFFEINQEIFKATLRHCQTYCPQDFLSDMKALESKGLPIIQELQKEFIQDFASEFTDKEIAYLNELISSPVMKKLMAKKRAYPVDKRIVKKLSKL